MRLVLQGAALVSDQFTMEVYDGEPLVEEVPAPEPETAAIAPPKTHARLVRVAAPVCPDHGKRACLRYLDEDDDGASVYVCMGGAP